MPRVKKSSHEKLNDSINVPVNRALKRRVLAVASALPGQPPITRLVRTYIERCVEQDEKQGPLVTA